MKYFACSIALGIALYASTARAQTFATLVQFSGTGGAASGAYPWGSLTLSGTTLYGMTFAGGGNGLGSVFSAGMDGTNYQNVLSFTGTGGAESGYFPYGNLTLSGTALYGMTVAGGAGGYGNLFSVGTSGTNYQNVLSFTGTDGAASGYGPYGSLTLSGTTLYGMTSYGGAGGNGNVFSAGTDGSNYRNLVSFTGTGGTASGDEPFVGSLTPSGTTLYGMTQEGGGNGLGNVFSVGMDGTNYRNVVSFTGTGGAASGEDPTGSLTLSGTTLYGMTCFGGTGGGYGCIFSAGTDGTNYRNLVSFSGSGGAASGVHPDGSLTLSGTTLYGMTSNGGVNGEGNIFSVGIDGSDYQDLYSFSGGADGAHPQGDLTLSGGTLFGMTNNFGANGDGTIFALVVPEPGTLAIAGGAVALVSYRRRRRRSRRKVESQMSK